jgi:5-methyltetrahydrofolate--homocysteine methyltransferase
MKGRHPGILDDPRVGTQARELLGDARRLLEEIVTSRSLRARGVFGFFPANSSGDDIILYEDESRGPERARLFTLRQQRPKPDGRPLRALADFVAPRGTGITDYLGAFAVTAGIGIDELTARFEADHDDYNAIMTKALADRLAEAFAELLHERARNDWGYGQEEELTQKDRIRERYRGIRPAPGYPACPDHTEKRTLFELLGGEEATGIRLTESFAMSPAASVSGFYFSHEESCYFAVGKLGRDQVADYAARKGIEVAEAERWLEPNLGYSR